jgi:hypothetical protein
MLVYANNFRLRPNNGHLAIVREIALWVGEKQKVSVDPNQLANGVREFRMSNGATLSSLVTLDAQRAPVFPYLFCAKLLHSDPIVSGRRWITEVGMRQLSAEEEIHCSVLLRTEEISARVSSTIQVTCPRIVKNLIEKCNPIEHTPSRSVIRLTEDNASAFLYEVERADRGYPLIQVSHRSDGSAPVSPERLRQVVIGLAQVIEISKTSDTFAIEDKIGRRYSAFGGAINIIFPFQKTNTGGFCKTVRIQADALDDLTAGGTSVESEILSIVTHQANIPNSWKHISSEIVAQEILRERLRNAAKSAHSSGDMSVYEELLAEAGEGLQRGREDISDLREALRLSEANLAQAQAETEGLKHALSGASSGRDFDLTNLADSIAPLRELMQGALKDDLSLEKTLKLVSTLYPERLVVLDSAISSARESDRGGFQHAKKALEILLNLSTSYWDSMAMGEGDQVAKTVFGKNGFAAKEAKSLSKDGRDRRTFTYRGQNVFMEKHLKHGVKDSLAETLRVHFAWFDDRKEIVIGHCGKHLDF